MIKAAAGGGGKGMRLVKSLSRAGAARLILFHHGPDRNDHQLMSTVSALAQERCKDSPVAAEVGYETQVLDPTEHRTVS